MEDIPEVSSPAALSIRRRLEQARTLVLVWLQQVRQRQPLQVILMLTPIAVLILAAYLTIKPASQPPPAVIVQPSPTPTILQASVSAKVISEIIKIDISGAVNQPGLKELHSGDRVHDAILAAGGLTVEADSELLAQALNLAQVLNDGDKIYIPAKGATPVVAPQQLAGKQVAGTSISPNQHTQTEIKGDNSANENNPGGKISINHASQKELESLHGIGPAYAQKIMNGRPYASTNDLCTKKIIPRSDTCQNIQPYISL